MRPESAKVLLGNKAKQSKPQDARPKSSKSIANQ